MNKQINGLDKNSIPRVYGIGRTRQEALTNCTVAAREYLSGGRRDIDTLYMVDDTGEPVFYAGLNVQWQVNRSATK